MNSPSRGLSRSWPSSPPFRQDARFSVSDARSARRASLGPKTDVPHSRMSPELFLPSSSAKKPARPRAERFSMRTFRILLLGVFAVALMPLATLVIFTFVQGTQGVGAHSLPETLVTLSIMFAFSLAICSLIGEVLFIVHVKALQDLADLKGDLIALATHQIRTPIAVLRWNIEVLDTGAKRMSAKEQQLVDDITHAGEQLEGV